MFDVTKAKPMNIKIDRSGLRDKIVLNIRRVLVYIVLILLTAISLFAFYILIVNCTHSHYEITKGFNAWFGDQFVTNWHNLFDDKNLFVGTAFRNSIIVSSATAILSVYFSTLTAYAVHKYDFKGKGLLYTFILMIMMIPTQIAGIGLFNMMSDMDLLNTFIPVIVPSVAAPVVVFYMKQYLDTVLPKEMIEAARIDGTGEIRIFHTMVLPVVKPALAIQFIFNFVTSWNNYFIPQLMLQDKDVRTIPIVIGMLRSSQPATFDLGKVYMLLMVSIIPLLIVYLIFSRFIIKNLTQGSVKG